MDKHLNIFYAYRHGGYRDTERERILEDNVTRALMIVLRSSCVLTRKFLAKFAAIDSEGPYEYDLQSELQDVELWTKNRIGTPAKRLIVIEKNAQLPRTMKIADGVLNDFEISLKDDSSRKRLQNGLSRLCDSIREEGQSEQRIEGRLKRALGIEHKNTDDSDLGHPDLPSYLYGLTLGSRPDASITTENINVLFENKLHGGVTDVQIRRHLRVSFGKGFQPDYRVRSTSVGRAEENLIPVPIWAWSDVYEFLSGASENEDLDLSPVSQFLIHQILEYLEQNNLGMVKFTKDDFVAWEYGGDGDLLGSLHDRVKELGKELADALGEHRMMPQNRTHNYLGINILSDKYKCEPVVQVPHYSLALVRDKGLVLFVTCESKPLTDKLLKNRENLERNLADALWEMGDLSNLTLKTTERRFKLPGASYYFDHSEVNLDKCVIKSGLNASVRKIFDDLEYLRTPEEAKASGECQNEKPQVRTVHGTHGFSYVWDVMTLEKWNMAIVEQVINKARTMRPYYDVIMEVYGQE